MVHVTRRHLITLLGGAAACPLAARAQQSVRVWRVGYLTPGRAEPDPPGGFQMFKLRLRDLGYVEGQNLLLDVRGADGDFSRLPTLAAELVKMQPDVIVAIASPAVLAAKGATSTIPIVMGPTADPIGSGIIQSLAKPGGNVTGVSLMSPDLTTKTVELLNTLVPSARRIAVLMSTNPMHALQIKQAHTAARVLGLTVVPITAALPSDLDGAFRTMQAQNCDGLVVLADPIVRDIPDLAAKARLPTVYQLDRFVRLGGLMSYGPNSLDLFRRIAVYVDKILKGASPADLPVEQPTKFELLINLKTAKALGLEVPPMLLARADEVIE
jgi:putative ABC transport system substrate-binding protein